MTDCNLTPTPAKPLKIVIFGATDSLRHSLADWLWRLNRGFAGPVELHYTRPDEISRFLYEPTNGIAVIHGSDIEYVQDLIRNDNTNSFNILFVPSPRLVEDSESVDIDTVIKTTHDHLAG